LNSDSTVAKLPLAIANPVPCHVHLHRHDTGWPTPLSLSRTGYEQKTLDLNDRFIANPPATFFFTLKGDSMVGAGIFDGATLIVDRSLWPSPPTLSLPM
jgi:DNA polymerase V